MLVKIANYVMSRLELGPSGELRLRNQSPDGAVVKVIVTGENKLYRRTEW